MVAVAMAVVVIGCAAAVDAAATILMSSLMAAAKISLLPLPSTITAVDGYCRCRQQTTTAGFWWLPLSAVAAAMVVVSGGNSGCRQRQRQGVRVRWSNGQGCNGKCNASAGKRARVDKGTRARARVDQC